MSTTNPGGTPDYIIDLQAQGMCSTTELAQRLGFPTLSGTWIVNELKVRPAIVVRQGAANYWSAEQVRQVRRALILRLLAQEFEA